MDEMLLLLLWAVQICNVSLSEECQPVLPDNDLLQWPADSHAVNATQTDSVWREGTNDKHCKMRYNVQRVCRLGSIPSKRK